MIKAGWTAITDTLSDFHRTLVNLFPHYASIAVQQMQLPADIFALTSEERERLRAIVPSRTWDHPFYSGDNKTSISCGCTPATLFRGEKATSPEPLPEAVFDTWSEVSNTPAKSAAGDYSLLGKLLVDSLAFKKTSIRGYPYSHTKSRAQKRTLVFCESHKAGDTRGIMVMPGGLFRSESMSLLTDSYDGDGTEIAYVLVGNRIQKFAGLPRGGVFVPTREVADILKFERAAVEGTALHFDTCQPAIGIAFMVKFLKDCEFRAEIEGTWVPE